jgi:hypothetical protein
MESVTMLTSLPQIRYLPGVSLGVKAAIRGQSAQDLPDRSDYCLSLCVALPQRAEQVFKAPRDN